MSKGGLMRRSTLAFTLLLSSWAATADAASVTFTKLTGLTGGSPANTAVFKADLSSLGLAELLSITITDGSFGLGGAVGQFSGFDLDAVRISTVDCADAACAAGAASAGAIDFAGALFTPGAQRPTVDPKLFGTGPAGNTLNNAVATLGAFDANSTTDASAFGFLSMGDGGQLRLNLAAAVSTTGLYLYIGEVGDNGEVAAGSVEVSDQPVPEPVTLTLFGAALIAAGARRRLRR